MNGQLALDIGWPEADPGQRAADIAVIHRATVIYTVPPEIEALLETADGRIDAFLHVDTFDPTASAYLRYSLSAKVPWYLAAGAPLFAYGSPELGTLRFLAEHRCAAVVGERDPRSLSDRLREFIQDGAARGRLGGQARLVAAERFDARLQRDAFREVLAAAAWGAPGHATHAAAASAEGRE